MIDSGDNKEITLPNTYLGIENDAKEGCPTFCIEFDISFRLFILALILSKLETCCNDEPEES